MFKIVNQGALIAETNYWDTPHAAKGFAFLSFNAGAARLLLPPPLDANIKEMRSADQVVVTFGPWPDQGSRSAFEIMFEDHSDEPFVVSLVEEQCDRPPHAPATPRPILFSVWTRLGKAFERPAYLRSGTLPCLQPLQF